ncbi:hypothetical protein QFC22_002904 [Naganishia vaughanmartiniae]|uniref:Uncharacterized protein n=1 Tax=Naganishia vaughanmartiniae TaxID=1424756 RepID=A0ACC2X7X9_9TREE|nr:hypothetical protein QFC22_002904 [Naganishia vaughanmartiniae]
MAPKEAKPYGLSSTSPGRHARIMGDIGRGRSSSSGTEQSDTPRIEFRQLTDLSQPGHTIYALLGRNDQVLQQTVSAGWPEEN